MSDEISLLGNFAGIVAACFAAWYLKLPVWKGAVLGAALVLTPIAVEEIWPAVDLAGIAAGIVCFVAAASALKIGFKHAALLFAASLVVLFVIALMVQADSLQSV